SELRRLDLRDAALGPEGAAALARNPHLANLRELDLTFNNLGNEGARALAASPHLANLRQLKLHNNDLTPSVIRHLAASPHLARLRYLGLCGNHDLHEGGTRAEFEARLRTCFRLPRLLAVEGNDWDSPVTLLRPAGS